METTGKVWVILRETGEYSDRDVTAIRFCLTETDAQRAVELTSIEAQRDAASKPVYRRKSTHGYQMPDGSWLPEGTSFMDPLAKVAKHIPLPDADAIAAQNELWAQEYDAACCALGHVDEEGSWRGDRYYYEEVALWSPATIKSKEAA